MRRIIDMTPGGSFTLTDDPDGTIAAALALALAPQLGEQWRTALRPDGDGLEVEGVGMIARAYHRDDLPFQFQDAPDLDPQTQELWWVQRERTRDYPQGRCGVITGDELRELVRQGSELRAQRK